MSFCPGQFEKALVQAGNLRDTARARLVDELEVSPVDAP